LRISKKSAVSWKKRRSDICTKLKCKIFPAAIILAALVFGTEGGLIADVAGSVYSALLLGNPYIIAGIADSFNHEYEPQGKPWTLILQQAACIIPSAMRDCSTYKFQYTSF
jgi:uncharacterized membrane protein YeiH